jgi:hypothetical protein
MSSVQWRQLEGHRDVTASCIGGSLKGSMQWRQLVGQRVVAAACMTA